MKVSKKQINVLIEQILSDVQEENGPFGEIFPDEEYLGLAESTKAHMDRILANLRDMSELAGDSPGYDLEKVLRVALKLKQIIERL
jgi:hypothetical protein